VEVEEELVVGGRPKAYDLEVRNLACLVKNLDKFISSFEMTVSDSDSGQINKRLSMEFNDDEEQAPVNDNYLKTKKSMINQMYNSLLVMFYWRPTTWLLLSGVGVRDRTKKIFSEMREGLKRVEALVTRLIQVGILHQSVLFC